MERTYNLAEPREFDYNTIRGVYFEALSDVVRGWGREFPIEKLNLAGRLQTTLKFE